VVVVSHDREFLDGLVDRIYEFRDGGVREYLGDIWYFLEKRKVESLQEIEYKERPSVDKSAMESTNAGKLSYEQKKEQEKLLRKLRKAVESVEEELAKVEAEIAAYDKRFAEATEYNADDYAKYDALKQRYDLLMHEWEKASYELEITEQN
jgi:ATP-binding cassette subfamily F protein 3